MVSWFSPSSGMQIINDQLTITNATDSQIRNAFKEPAAAATAPPTTTALSPAQQQALLLFMQVGQVRI